MEAQGQVAVVGAGAMGAGIAQVAATAGHEVHLVDGRDGAAQAAVDGVVRRLHDRSNAAARPARRPTPVAGQLHVVGTVADLPACALVLEAVTEDLAVKQDLLHELSTTSQHDPAGQQHLQPRRRPDRRRRRVARTRPGTALLQPRAGDAACRGRCRGTDRQRVRRLRRRRSCAPGARRRSAAAAPPGSSSTGSHGRSTARRSGCSPTGRRRRDARRGPARRRLQARPARADRPHRPGRQPRRRHERVGADRPRPALRAGAAPAGPRRAGTPRAQERSRRLPVRRRRQALDAQPDEARVAELVGGPLVTDPVARTLAMLVNEAVDLVERGEASAEGRRPRDAARRRLPARADRVGTRDRVRRRRAAAARARRRVPRRPLPPEPRSVEGHIIDRYIAGSVLPGRHRSGPRPPDVGRRPRLAGLGMELVELATDRAVVRMTVDERMVNGHGIAHGGFVFTLADSAFALACNSARRAHRRRRRRRHLRHQRARGRRPGRRGGGAGVVRAQWPHRRAGDPRGRWRARRRAARPLAEPAPALTLIGTTPPTPA